MGIRITVANEGDGGRWDGFCSRNPDAYHGLLFGWRAVIQRAFGHKPYYLLAEEEGTGEVVGVCPLFRVHSFLFGTALISLPYLNGAGCQAEDEIAHRALIEYLPHLARSLNASYVELRERESKSEAVLNGWQYRGHKVSMQLSLLNDPQALFASFPAKLRSQVRRPTKEGCYATCARTTDEMLAAVDDFYSVFSRHMRDLGTPVYPRNLFRQVVQGFGDKVRVFVVRHGDTPVAASMTIGRGRSVEVPWAAALRKYHEYSPNMLLYWEMIKNACEEGYSVFDFGRSSLDSGTHKFKAQWGAKEVPLHWYYHLAAGEIPDVNPKSTKYAALVKTWQHLPLPVANLVGPILTRGLP